MLSPRLMESGHAHIKLYVWLEEELPRDSLSMACEAEKLLQEELERLLEDLLDASIPPLIPQPAKTS